MRTLASLVLLSGVALAQQEATPVPPQLGLVPNSALAPDGTVYVEGELIVAWEPEADQGAVRAAIEGLGGKVRREITNLRVLIVDLPPSTTAPVELALYAELDGVAYAELNGVGMGGSTIPNDTHFAAQWQLQNTAQNLGTPGADIEAVPAWKIEKGDAAVVLAILDSGIFPNHAEFIGRTLQGFDFVNNDNNPFADHPHGVHVTALAAANTNNNFGVAGVDQKCTILPVKVLNSNNGGTVIWLVDGLDYSAQQGAEVVSMSLINYPNSPTIEAALQGCRNVGCILVACAGNGGIGNANTSWPGASDLTMSIGATTPTDARAGFSGTGSKLDFVAPGQNTVTINDNGQNATELFSGCSAATPIAAGIVSLLKAQDPGMTQDQAYDRLRDGAEDQVGPPNEDMPGRDDFFGWGRLNAKQSLEILGPSGIGQVYCTPNIANSTGQPAEISAAGSDVAADNDVMLTCSEMPANQNGYFLNSMTQAFVPIVPGSQGILCLGGAIGRYNGQVQNSGAMGTFTITLDLPNTPTPTGTVPILAGQRWNFTCWYRDLNPNATSNFSNALNLTFL